MYNMNVEKVDKDNMIVSTKNKQFKCKQLIFCCGKRTKEWSKDRYKRVQIWEVQYRVYDAKLPIWIDRSGHGGEFYALPEGDNLDEYKIG